MGFLNHQTELGGPRIDPSWSCAGVSTCGNVAMQHLAKLYWKVYENNIIPPGSLPI